MADELQVIPARHGMATFVPAGQTIKIINTSGTQVIDTWAFALPKPDEKGAPEQVKDEKNDEQKQYQSKQSRSENTSTPQKAVSKKGKRGSELPSQEDAEKATQEGMLKAESTSNQAQNQAQNQTQTPQKSSWSSYVPSLGLTSSGKKGAGGEASQKNETEQQKNSRTWASYIPSGKGFSSYIPRSASDTVTAFAQDHQRDMSKSYLEQLQDFSKTPVGAAGMAALTGSGYGGSLYAGYQAYNATHAPDAPAMEYMSMPHTRSGTLHIRPKVNDTLYSNLREPMMVLVEDSSPGIHDTLMAACDPQRYQGLGVQNWEQHGSCAENLVLALKELNERAGLKGAKAIGAEVTINAVPAPLNLFMNIPWDEDGDLGFKAPKGKEGDYVRLKAERDVVVVMSACPQDILDINSKKPTDAHFVVEGGVDDAQQQKTKSAQPARKRPPPKKLNSSTRARSNAAISAADDGDDDAKAGATPAKKPVPARRQPVAKKPAGSATPQKKPVPRPPQPQRKKATGDNTNDETDSKPPVERKKPRKLAQRPKAEAPKPDGDGTAEAGSENKENQQ
ncbi:hypothetical protein KC332_g8558 [Hortaea werneckii]|uniref:DUF1989 domain-containing protein n=2 Tax=Hortaea werneckii TaxID=91943 RepID=A0A3M7IP10_HORWE|nr:hypothetical protein KC358_g8442 [Hortaea werneckii]OTA37122.1 hypothetical protein BTJ68_02951 [Hortaea werneckii EXF-2000]KAI6829916.1 hypothetical protein KC350_g7716 [Hortaea werneckii]KAI6926587.1 hypothetical protein KC348_g8630 [Hortaea werneckii]KAI6933716.1 hypothetical protein KC341_g8100 [Hortaea werneckii]